MEKGSASQAAVTKAAGKTADSQSMPNANGSTGAPGTQEKETKCL